MKLSTKHCKALRELIKSEPDFCKSLKHAERLIDGWHFEHFTMIRHGFAWHFDDNFGVTVTDGNTHYLTIEKTRDRALIRFVFGTDFEDGGGERWMDFDFGEFVAAFNACTTKDLEPLASHGKDVWIAFGSDGVCEIGGDPAGGYIDPETGEPFGHIAPDDVDSPEALRFDEALESDPDKSVIYPRDVVLAALALWGVK